MTALENELTNVKTSIESSDTRFTNIETMLQQVLKSVDDLGGNGIGQFGVIRCIPTCDSDNDSLSFGHYGSYTIAHICLEPLPTLSFRKFSTPPLRLGLSSLTPGSIVYLLNLPTNITIASMTMTDLYLIRGTLKPPWGVCDVYTGLACSTASWVIQMWLVFVMISTHRGRVPFKRGRMMVN
ncbi:hypothetical protein Ddye_021247 [Dipteronia dyeriana]|uniref:Uncharacterized protein n=1 Tax=Dipteronia dyeriana TaxID=168575 RepID=A0AAD9WXJ0_9ROSI|nr:hypothetical protein Ddye_021247 [Dipteronia dyeriana]